MNGSTGTDELRLGQRLDIAVEEEARLLAGRLVVMDRGTLPDPNGDPAAAVLVCGILVAMDGKPLMMPEPIAAAGSERWDVEVVVLARRRFVGTEAIHRGEIARVAMLGLNNDDYWDGLAASTWG